MGKKLRKKQYRRLLPSEESKPVDLVTGNIVIWNDESLFGDTGLSGNKQEPLFSQPYRNCNEMKSTAPLDERRLPVYQQYRHLSKQLHR